MTHRQNPFLAPHRLPVAGSLAFALAVFPMVPAQAQAWRGGVNVSVAAEASTNPYLEQGDADITASANAQVSPWIQFDDGRTGYTLNASFDGRVFASGYDFQDNYSISMGLRHRASERLSLRANAGLLTTASSFGSLFTSSVGSVDGPLLPDDINVIDPGEDISLLGSRGRSSALMFGVGADLAFDARNQLTLSGDVRESWSNRFNSQDYRSYDAQARFMHVIDEGTSVGAVVSVQQTDYERPTVGDGRTVSTMGSLNHRLGQYWTIDASVGAAFTRIDASATAPELEYSSLSMQSSLCNRTERRALCLRYERSPEPSAYGGVRTSDAFNASLDARLSERDRMSFGVRYSRNGRSKVDPVTFPQVDYLNFNAQVRRQFNPRMSGFVSGTLSRVDRPDLDVEPSASVGVGVTVSLGRPQ